MLVLSNLLHGQTISLVTLLHSELLLL
jgi:hypothetical protein